MPSLSRFVAGAALLAAGAVGGYLAHPVPGPCSSVANVASWPEVRWHARNIAWDLAREKFQWSASEATVVSCDLRVLGYRR